MSVKISFSGDRFKRVAEVYEKWWDGKGARPVAGTMIAVRRPQIADPKVPMLWQDNVHLDTPVDKLLDAVEYAYSQYEFYGDAFPFFNMHCFGPGVVSAFLGAELNNSTGLIWFHPKERLDITKAHFEFDPDNYWYKRVIEICKKASERFGDKLIFGMPDLGGVMDVLSAFFPGEELMLAMYDEPEHVKRLMTEISGLWHLYYNNIAKALQSDKLGYTDWSGTYSKVPSYVTQCDISYMLGNDTYKEFVLPELKITFDKLKHNLFHLDGIGELNHLDTLLSLPKLNAIQWIAGTGHDADMAEWVHIYKRIAEGGKGMQFTAIGFDKFDALLNKVGHAEKAQYFYNAVEEKDKEQAFNFFKKYKIEK